VKRMQAAMETLEKQSSRDKMIIKFRDSRITTLEGNTEQTVEGCDKCA